MNGTKGKPKLWTKDFVIISITTFFVFLTFYLLMTSLAVYAIEEFQASQSEAGLASSIFVIGALVFRLFAGKYIELMGRKRMLFGGLLLFLIATLLYFVVGNLTLLLVVRFIHGGAFGLTTTATATTIMDIIPDERRGEGTSYYSLSTVLAMAIGPFLGIIISQDAENSVIFVVCSIFSVSGIIISLFAKVPEAKLTDEHRAALRGFRMQDFFEKKALPIASIAAIIGFSYSGILTFLNSYAEEIHLSELASFFFIVYAFFVLISRPFTGKLMDLKGENIVMYPAMIVFSIGLFVISQVHQGFTLFVAGALIGLGFGTITSIAQAIAVKESPKHRVALATSTYFIFFDGGIGIGPFLLGLLIPVVSFRGLFLIVAVVVLLTVLLYYFLHGKKVYIRKKFAHEGKFSSI